MLTGGIRETLTPGQEKLSKSASWFLKWIAAPSGVIAAVVLLTGALDLRYVTHEKHDALASDVRILDLRVDRDSIQNELIICYLRALYAGNPEPPCGLGVK